MSSIKFIKWPDIDNISTVSKSSLDFQKAHNINNWVVTEKIDGTNISVNVTKDKVLLGKRTSLLEEGSSFYNVYNNINQIEPVINAMKKLISENDDVAEQVTLYGEYFGPKVMNRIYYGNNYQFRFYGMYVIYKDGIDNVLWMPFYYFRDFMREYGIEDFMVPVIGEYKTFEEACNHPNDMITDFAYGNHHDEMEGVVISPIYESPVSANGKFIFKSKNPKFSEKHCKSTTEKYCESSDESELKKAKEIFKEYCVESRMYSVISKEGVPNGTKDAGKYISMFIIDAKKDFLKENPDYKKFTNKEMKYITNIGNVGFIIFSNVYDSLVN